MSKRQDTGTAYVATPDRQRLNVRAEPSLRAPVARTVGKGDAVIVEEVRDGWARLHDGWARLEHLSPAPDGQPEEEGKEADDA